MVHYVTMLATREETSQARDCTDIHKQSQCVDAGLNVPFIDELQPEFSFATTIQ